MKALNVTRWPKRLLGDLGDFRNGVNYSKDSFGLGIKVVGVSDFQDYTKPKYEELAQINPTGIVTARNLLRDGDIVFVRSNGNRELIGRSLLIEKPPEELTHSAFTIRLRFKSTNETDPKFYAYLFRTSVIRQGLAAAGGGTNISNLNQDLLGALEVPIPPLAEQRRLAGILAAYDDLIGNCERRIKLLDEMARAIYREWFGGSLPAGWRRTTMGEVADEVRRNVPKGAVAGNAYVGLEHIPRRSLALDAWELVEELGSNKLRFEPGEVLFGKIRPYFHKVAVAPCAGVCSADTFVVRPREPELYGFMVAALSSDEFVAHASATANGAKMPRANWDVMMQFPIALPPTELLLRFDRVMRPWLETQRNLVARIRNLREARDLLLPRLLSGQLSVAEAA